MNWSRVSCIAWVTFISSPVGLLVRPCALPSCRSWSRLSEAPPWLFRRALSPLWCVLPPPIQPEGSRVHSAIDLSLHEATIGCGGLGFRLLLIFLTAGCPHRHLVVPFGNAFHHLPSFWIMQPG